MGRRYRGRPRANNHWKSGSVNKAIKQIAEKSTSLGVTASEASPQNDGQTETDVKTEAECPHTNGVSLKNGEERCRKDVQMGKDLVAEERLLLKECVKKLHCKDHKYREGLLIGKLCMNIDHRNEYDKVQKLSLGKPNNNPTKVIMLIGATGTGKTTLINAMVNYIYRLDFTDPFRLCLVDEKDDPDRTEAESQTDFITAYAFHSMPGMPFNYNYVLIDTPGFGDTRGIERDRQMMIQIEQFLKQDYGVDQVDGVGFVIPAASTRLTQTQRYVYDGLLSIFGNDIRDNIFIMATFSDARKPPVLAALKMADLEFGEIYKFNNSALYARNKKEEFAELEHSDSDDEETISMSKQYWTMAERSMDNFFTKLGQANSASLTLTKEVLKERRQLQTVLIGLQTQISLGLSKLAILSTERDLLARLDDDMKGSSNYTMEVDVPKINKIDLARNECVTNCLKCSLTCHFPCHLPKLQDKKNCGAMRNGICKVCPSNCPWDVHKHMDFRYETTWNKEIRTAEELMQRYMSAVNGKMTKEKVISCLMADINQLSQVLLGMIVQVQKHVERLEEIALKPNPLSTKEYIDLMIESEKMQKRHKYEERIKMLQKIREECQILQAATNAVNLSVSGEALLKYFQDLMI